MMMYNPRAILISFGQIKIKTPTIIARTAEVIPTLIIAIVYLEFRRIYRLRFSLFLSVLGA